MNDIILKVDHLSKYFALVKALDDISFDVRRGEVHALCGENGAVIAAVLAAIVTIFLY